MDSCSDHSYRCQWEGCLQNMCLWCHKPFFQAHNKMGGLWFLAWLRTIKASAQYHEHYIRRIWTEAVIASYPNAFIGVCWLFCSNGMPAYLLRSQDYFEALLIISEPRRHQLKVSRDFCFPRYLSGFCTAQLLSSKCALSNVPWISTRPDGQIYSNTKIFWAQQLHICLCPGLCFLLLG